MVSAVALRVVADLALLLASVGACAWALRAHRRERRLSGHGTARRAAEAALRDSERRHRIVLQHLPGASVGLYDLDLRCLLLEGPHLELAGIDGAAMVGRHVSEIVSPELFAATEQIVSDSLAGQDGSVEIVSATTGRTIVIQSAPVRTHDGAIEGIVVVSRDVTEQRLAERAGREAEQRFEIAFDRAPIGMALIGVGGSVERVNAALSTITGRSAEELAALRHEELLHPDDEELAAEAFASLLADDGMATELRIVHADGHPVWVSLRATIVRDDDGTPVHVLVQVQDVTERRRLEDQLRHLADHDALTGLLNRRGIDRALAQHVARGRRYGAEGALLVLDLDGFKTVNDTLGHAAGDELIVTCADALRNRLRETDILARLGGDEFAVLLPAEGEAEALIVAEAIVNVIREVTGVTASVGVTPFGDEPTTTSALDRADMAMYAAKQAGRDRYEFTPGPLPATA
jgi:diguanylate cyclase (GGDEF)-like protein/PAS domain S-box-containing protein